MPKFRKKLPVEAWQWTGKHLEAAPEWLVDAARDVCVAGQCLLIETSKDEMVADPGDWIIRGVKGELYPIKDSIFRETYEPVEEVSDE